jgi:hypothetical protein
MAKKINNKEHEPKKVVAKCDHPSEVVAFCNHPVVTEGLFFCYMLISVTKEPSPCFPEDVS